MGQLPQGSARPKPWLGPSMGPEEGPGSAGGPGPHGRAQPQGYAAGLMIGTGSKCLNLS